MPTLEKMIDAAQIRFNKVVTARKEGKAKSSQLIETGIDYFEKCIRLENRNKNIS